MKILNISPRYLPARGGAESHLQEVVAHQMALGHEVTVLTTDALPFELFWQPNLPRVSKNGLDIPRVLRFPIEHLPGVPLSYRAVRRGIWWLSRLGAPIGILDRLARWTPKVPALFHWLRQTTEPFDLVASYNICYETFLEAGWQFAQRRGIPFMATPFTHLGAGSRPGSDSLSQFYTMRHQQRLVLSSSAAVMMTAAEQDFYLSRQKGRTADDFPVIGTGVHPQQVWGGNRERLRQQLSRSGAMVLTLSTLSADKGTVQTVEAVRMLWQKGEAVELWLAGTVTAPFGQFLAQLPATDRQRIRLLGQVDDQTRRDLFAACDLFVMPSRVDSFGIVYLEAWLYGKPVIGAEAWGIRDGVISPGQDGLLVPFGDVPALSQAILYLLHQPHIAQQLGENGKAKVLGEHTWATKWAKMEELYQRVMDQV